MGSSVKSHAIQAAYEALAETGSRWRGWGLRTILQRAVKAMEAEGYRIVDITVFDVTRKRQFDGTIAEGPAEARPSLPSTEAGGGTPTVGTEGTSRGEKPIVHTDGQES